MPKEPQSALEDGDKCRGERCAPSEYDSWGWGWPCLSVCSLSTIPSLPPFPLRVLLMMFFFLNQDTQTPNFSHFTSVVALPGTGEGLMEKRGHCKPTFKGPPEVTLTSWESHLALGRVESTLGVFLGTRKATNWSCDLRKLHLIKKNTKILSYIGVVCFYFSILISQFKLWVKVSPQPQTLSGKISLVHFFVLVSFKISSYILDRSPLSAIWFANIFPQVCSLSFLSLSSVFQRVNILNFDEVQFANFFLLWIMLRVSSAVHTLSLRMWQDESWLFRHQSLEERGPVYRKGYREMSRHLATRLAWHHQVGGATEEAEANQMPDSSSELSEQATRSHLARKEGNSITVSMVYLRITCLWWSVVQAMEALALRNRGEVKTHRQSTAALVNEL